MLRLLITTYFVLSPAFANSSNGVICNSIVTDLSKPESTVILTQRLSMFPNPNIGRRDIAFLTSVTAIHEGRKPEALTLHELGFYRDSSMAKSDYERVISVSGPAATVQEFLNRARSEFDGVSIFEPLAFRTRSAIATETIHLKTSVIDLSAVTEKLRKEFLRSGLDQVFDPQFEIENGKIILKGSGITRSLRNYLVSLSIRWQFLFQVQ